MTHPKDEANIKNGVVVDTEEETNEQNEGEANNQGEGEANEQGEKEADNSGNNETPNQTTEHADEAGEVDEDEKN